MRFESPEILWLLSLPLLMFLITILKSWAVYPARVIRLQSIVAAILVLALANPIKDNLQKAGSAAIVVDVSKSVDPQQMEQLYQQAKELTKELPEVSLIPFAEKSSTLSSPASEISSYQEVLNKSSQIPKERSNLQSALNLASAASANVVLISDGYQNMGNVLGSKEIVSSRIFPIIPQGSSSFRKQYVGLSGLDLPLIASAQKSVEIKSALQNTTATTQQGRLQVFHDDKQIFSEIINLAAGEERRVTANSDPAQDGIREIKSVFEPADKSFPKSTRIAYLSTEKREKVLLFSGSSEDARLLRQAFETQSYELVSVLPEQVVPQLEDFSAVLLNNIAVSQLPSGFSSQLSEYTRAGGGFIMLGGNRSYGLGGYVDSPISELLPVDPQPPQAQQKRLTVAVELVIDKSRSMADSDKLEFSKEAAREVVRNLKDEDFVGVIGFDASPFEVVKLGRVGEMRSQAMERIGRLFPAQKTNLFPAMDEGRRRLEAIDAGRKHMIILTDGKIPDADQSYLELVKQMRMQGITLSTVLVGSDYDFGFLKDMAERGGGAFYQTSDPSSLPRIFMQDVRVRSGEKTMQEQREFPVAIGPSGLKSTNIDDYPDLLGFVETKPKQAAALELTVRSQDKNFPLLASWKLGQGKVVAFTSDANGRWSRPWGTWSRFVPFWTDILDSVRSQGDQSPLRFDLHQQIEGDSIKLDLTLYDDPKGAAIEAQIIGPDGRQQALSFNELARGSYQAQLPTGASPGRYEFKASVGKRPLTPIAFDVAAINFKEEQGLGFNRPLLEALATLSSGKINPDISDLAETKTVVGSSTSYRWIFLTAALVLYLFGILWRELRLSTKSFKSSFSRQGRATV